MTDNHERLDELMRARRFELGIRTWRALSEKAGISYETLRALRAGGNPGDATADGLERALGWKSRSINTILSGGEPTPITREKRSPIEMQRELQERLDRILSEGDPGDVQALDKFTRAIDPGEHGSQTG